MKSFFSRYWVHFMALGLFFIATYAYFQPQFHGNRLKQHDIEQFKGMSNEIKHFREITGKEPLWTNAMFGGMPTYQISTKYSGNWFSNYSRALRLWLNSPAGIFFLYLIGFYIMLMCMRVKPVVAIFGAFAFAFSSYFIIILQAGHNTKAISIGLMAPVIGAFYMAYRHNLKWGILLSALFMGMQLAANHFQITFYLGILLLGLGLAELVRTLINKDIKKFAYATLGLLAAYGFALSINFGNISLTKDYAEHTIRGKNDISINPDGSSNEKDQTSGLSKDYITNWSYGIGESLTLLSPYVKGGSSSKIVNSQFSDKLRSKDFRRDAQLIGENDIYWGDQPFTSGPVYVGIIVFLLAILGLVYLHGPMKWALFTVALLALLLGFGKNFGREDLMVLNILLLLGAVLLFVFKSSGKYLLLVLSFLGWLLYLFGSGEMPVTNFFLDHVFGYNKFRAVTIILSVVELIIPVLGVLFLHKLISKKEEIKANIKPFYYTVGGFFGLLLILTFVGLGDDYMKSQERDYVFNYEQQVRQQIKNEDPAMFKEQYGIDVTKPKELDAVVQQQSEMINKQFDSLIEFRKSVYQGSMGRSILFLLLGAALIFAFIRYKIQHAYFVGGLLVLVLIDLVPVNLNYLNNEKQGRGYKYWVGADQFEYPVAATKADLEVLEREKQARPELAKEIEAVSTVPNKTKRGSNINAKHSEQFQILNLNTNYRVFEPEGGFNSSRASYFHKSLGGYHGAKLRNIQNLYEFHISQNNMAVLNMLNVKYILQGNGVQQNPSALGNAWFVKELRVKETRNKELQALGKEFEIQNLHDSYELLEGKTPVESAEVYGSEVVKISIPGDTLDVDLNQVTRSGMSATFVEDVNGDRNWIPTSELEKDTLDSFRPILKAQQIATFRPAEEAIISSDLSQEVESLTYSGLGEINATSYQPNKLTYTTISDERQFAVFSEIYYPDGWKAFIDGKEVPIHRVNYLLRGIEVPAGEHKIEMRFEVPTFETSNNIALAGSVLLALLLIGAFVKDFVLTRNKADE